MEEQRKETGFLTREELDAAVARFEKETKERPALDFFLSAFLLAPLVFFLYSLAAGRETTPWLTAQAFLFLIPLGAVWARHFLLRSLRRDFRLLVEQNRKLLAEIESLRVSTGKQPEDR